MNALGTYHDGNGDVRIMSVAPNVANAHNTAHNMDVKEATFINSYAHGLARDAGVLMMAASVDNLDAAQVNSYFQSVGLQIKGGPVAKWANSRANLVGDAVTQAAVVAYAGVNQWLKYRVTRASGVGLMQRAQATIPSAFSVAEVASVNNYAAAPWDATLLRLIAPATIAKSHAIGKAYGFLPDSWYMGDKAVGQYSAARYKALVDFSKLYATREGELINAGAEAANDLAALANIANVYRL
jgi:hypothetical protein